MKDDRNKRGIAVPEDSALGMLRKLISEERRVFEDKIVSRKEIDDAVFDGLKNWKPKFLPNGKIDDTGGDHTRSGIISAIAKVTGLAHPNITRFLHGESQSPYHFTMLLDAVNANPRERTRIMKVFFEERRDTIPFHSPEEMFASDRFREMDFREAMHMLTNCFVQNRDTGDLITIESYLKQLPNMAKGEASQFDPNTAKDKMRLVKDYSKKESQALMVPLKYYKTLGLNYEQSSRMLAKSWNPLETKWSGGQGRKHYHYTSPQEAFLSPPADNDDRLKTKGELLRELIESHCMIAKCDEKKPISWDKASERLLKALYEDDARIFEKLDLKPMALNDVSVHLGVSRTLVGKWVMEDEAIPVKYFEQIAAYFGLEKPLADAFIKAPNIIRNTWLTEDVGITAREYRRNLAEALDAPPPPEPTETRYTGLTEEQYRKNLAEPLPQPLVQESYVAKSRRSMQEYESLADIVKHEQRGRAKTTREL